MEPRTWESSHITGNKTKGSWGANTTQKKPMLEREHRIKTERGPASKKRNNLTQRKKVKRGGCCEWDWGVGRTLNKKYPALEEKKTRGEKKAYFRDLEYPHWGTGLQL